MKLKLKRVEFMSLAVVLKEMSTNTESYDKRFMFAVLRNLSCLESEIKSLQEIQKDTPKFTEFQQKMQAAGIEFSDKDEQGNPKFHTVNGTEVFSITEKKEEANKKIAEIQEEYKEVIQEKTKSIEQLNELMEEEIEQEICKISFSSFPEKVSADKYKYLKYLIKETDEELEALL